MNPIRTLDQLVESLQAASRAAAARPRRVAVAAGHDPSSIQAAARAATEGIAEMILVGDRTKILDLCRQRGIDASLFTVIDEPDLAAAGARARDLVREGQADVLMKGLLGTDKYMKLILDKDRGLLSPGNVLTHLTVLDVPSYQRTHGKLLFVSDVAIIPRPDLATKVKILRYCIEAARSFGIERPRAALIAANEKVSERMPETLDAAIIAKMADRGQVGEAIVDGPLALDVALSPEVCAIKELSSPVGGAADILIFPEITAGNVFYKSVTQFAGGRLAGVVIGTTAPCVLTSRADDEESKFLSIALGCRLAI
jgi:phosphate butyryltransferase